MTKRALPALRSGECRLWTVVAFLVLGAAPAAIAQIGGKTVADGPFLLEDAEDLDLTALGVQREWVPEFIPGDPDAADAVSLTTAGLALAPGQSPNGALRYIMPTSGGYIDYSFGVPMPAVAGASTATSPGNITSFGALTFLTRSSGSLANQQFLIVLEAYPQVSTPSGPQYPKIYWGYSFPAENSFRRVSIDLWNPSGIENAGGRTLEQLLTQTRFLAFTYFGGPVTQPGTVTVHVDDIRLLPGAGARDWALYD